MMTTAGIELHNGAIQKYMKSLIGQFYKILPIKESGEPSLDRYIESLQRELLGCKGLLAPLQEDEMFLSLLFILQYFLDNECDVPTVKSEVFKAINICNKLYTKYGCEVM